MNCQEFEEIVAELANDELMSASTRVSALAHAESCDQCAVGLSEHRVLGNAIRGFAEITAAEQAPPGLKQSLLNAFEARQAKETAEVAAVANVIRMPKREWRWQWALAAAAVIGIIFVIAASVWMNNQSSNKKDFVADATPTPGLIGPKEATEPGKQVEKAETQFAVTDKTDDKPKPKRRIQNGQKKSEPMIENNLAANYIPIGYSTVSGIQQDKLVVRVEVPRSTLIAMGLPLNAERGNELVKADLMVGLDGVPLAIRLVRQ